MESLITLSTELTKLFCF